jgi:hypothetical protein
MPGERWIGSIPVLQDYMYNNEQRSPISSLGLSIVINVYLAGITSYHSPELAI